MVNDIGAEADGRGYSSGPASEVVEAIVRMGGDAVANGDDVSDFKGARRLIDTAVETWGRLDVVVNNAGFLRDRMFVSTTEAEWDAVIRVHLRGHYAPSHHAALWLAGAREERPADRRGRIINTSLRRRGCWGAPSGSRRTRRRKPESRRLR